MSEQSLAHRLADHLIAVRARGAAALPAALAPDPTEAEAYAVQSLVAARLGPAGGFKVACKPGQPRIMAPILAADIIGSGAVLPVPAGEPVGIELEVGFRLLAPPPPPDAPDFEAALRGRVAAVPVIEIVRSRYPDAGAVSALHRLADNQINGGLVVGAPVADWRGLDLARPTARLQLGDRVALDGPAEVPGGAAFANLCVLARMVGHHCGGLKQGDVVITGSLNGLPYVTAPCRVVGQIAGLGEVSVDLAVG